jgi:hypothetical protein
VSVTTIIDDIDDPDEEQNKRAHRCYRRLYVFSLSSSFAEIYIRQRTDISRKKEEEERRRRKKRSVSY